MLGSEGHGPPRLQGGVHDVGRGRDELGAGHRAEVALPRSFQRKRKRTRSDHHSKQLVVDSAIKNKRFKTPMEACRVTDFACVTSFVCGRRWADEAFVHHRAGGIFECAEAGIVSVAAHAANCGRPAKYILIVLVSTWPLY